MVTGGDRPDVTLMLKITYPGSLAQFWTRMGHDQNSILCYLEIHSSAPAAFSVKVEFSVRVLQ